LTAISRERGSQAQPRAARSRQLPDGRHADRDHLRLCTDGDDLSGEPADELSLIVTGAFAGELGDPEDNLVLKAARALAKAA
jgi:hypothetical protein